LDYLVPETLADRVGVGSRVRVPFRDKSTLATVVAALDHSEAEGIRPIEAVIGEAPILSEQLLELARWISAYYCCPIETVMRSLLPQVIRRAEVGWKKQLFVRPARKIDNEEIEKLRKRAPRQAELLEVIAQLEGAMRAADLLRHTSLDNQTLLALVRRGLAELHGHLSEGERHDEWHKIHSGRARIAIGPRSAVFAPLKSLGLIVVDEEHENTYKQEEAPRYHARDVAVVRAKIEKCVVVLGSATPSLESYHNATTGKYRLATLTHRVDQKQMPLMRVVDLRQERRKERAIAILSGKL